jgi:FkbM family methyltransferase
LKPIHTVSFKGHEFRIQEGSVHPAYSVECFIKDESEFRNTYWDIKPGEVVVDVGASYGAYTLTAAACGAQVLAFEPEPTVFVDLLENIKLNPGMQVKPVCGALAEKSGLMNMAIYAPHWPKQTISCSYPALPLDTLPLDHCDWLKIDVEGAEYSVILGATATLWRHRPKLIIESHIFLDAAMTSNLMDYLKAGYDFEVIPREPCEMLIARPK